jgi:hypothetical protein
MMNFEELDDTTRHYMLSEFEAEEAAANPYRSKTLSLTGRQAFPRLLSDAIQNGNEESLIVALSEPSHWKPTDARGARINIRQAAERLGLTEFNTWYVRGLSKRLIEEGVTHCEVYRAGYPSGGPNSECVQHEGQVYLVEDIYRGHRARYWPEPGNRNALSIPIGPSCHHTIRRVD